MRIIRVFIFVLILALTPLTGVNAQLKKTANIQLVKTFTNGSVSLNKTAISTVDSVSIYSLILRNNSKLFESIVFYLGDREEMIKNLNDLSAALQEGKKGDVFDFKAGGVNYTLSYDKVLGQVCFRVSKPHFTSNDFGRLYKATIDDILVFLKKENNN